MPVYEYECENCSNKVEIYKRISEADDTEVCKQCGRQLVKIMSQCTFHLKGGGWYATGGIQ